MPAAVSANQARTLRMHAHGLLDGDRLVARIDPKYHRERGPFELKSVHWEPARTRHAGLAAWFV